MSRTDGNRPLASFDWQVILADWDSEPLEDDFVDRTAPSALAGGTTDFQVPSAVEAAVDALVLPAPPIDPNAPLSAGVRTDGGVRISEATAVAASAGGDSVDRASDVPLPRVSELPVDPAPRPLPSDPVPIATPHTVRDEQKTVPTVIAASTFVRAERSAPSPETRPDLNGASGSTSTRPPSELTRSDRLSATAAWLVEEASVKRDPQARAQALFIASEIFALANELGHTAELTAEAIALDPSDALGVRQARCGYSEADLLASLDAEAAVGVTAAARLHAALFAAEISYRAGDATSAEAHIDHAARLDPVDARPIVTRAANALARDDTASPALRVHDPLVSSSLASAIANALRGRGGFPADAAGEPSGVDVLRRARAALATGDGTAAAERIVELSSPPGLAAAATWLAAALAGARQTSRAKSATWLRELLAAGAPSAPTCLAARALELGDRAMLGEALGDGSAFGIVDRVVLAALAGIQLSGLAEAVASLHAHDDTAPLASGLSSLVKPTQLASLAPDSRDAAVAAYANCVAGSSATRAVATFARLLGHAASTTRLSGAVSALRETDPERFTALSLVFAARDSDAETLVAILLADDTFPEGRADRCLAAGLIAVHGGLPRAAEAAFQAAHDADANHPCARRALAGEAQQRDPTAQMRSRAAHEAEPTSAAVAQLLLLAHDRQLEAPGSMDAFARIQELLPHLPIGAFFGESLARRLGDHGATVRWIEERRKVGSDPLERAIDALRQAAVYPDSEPRPRRDRIEEASHLLPNDLALRELLETVSPDRIEDRGSWRELRAGAVTGAPRLSLLLGAARDFERQGDPGAMLRLARAALADHETDAQALLLVERAELASGEPARIADALLVASREAGQGVVARRETFERLAELDAQIRRDPASAVLWHRAILEESPLHLPSLRHVEQALIGDRRDSELRVISATVATALKRTNSGEAAAHLFLASRVSMREGEWSATEALATEGSTERDPTFWSLRLAHAHARIGGDGATMLATTMSLLARSASEMDQAALSVSAAEIARAQGDAPLTLRLLEAAAILDPADVGTWSRLAAARTRSENSKMAAEAHEQLAQRSGVEAHQIVAWFDAGLCWLNVDRTDPDRAARELRAREALARAAKLDVGYKDVFLRLAALYARTGANAALAALIDKRIPGVVDPEERVALEIDRGRALVACGEARQGRDAYESALAIQPDNVEALTALADLAVEQCDWDAAEKAWVSLARLAASPEEQQPIYERLGDLYLTKLENLARAELAFSEVLKHAPGDVAAREGLVEVYKRQNDGARALTLQEQLVTESADHDVRKRRLVQLASVVEMASSEPRRAEQILEAARREFPTDVPILRALGDYHLRHHQDAAAKLLFDRSVADVTRAFGSGRFNPAFFETLAAVNELRGDDGAARTVNATLAAFLGHPSALKGGYAAALDSALDAQLAPETLLPPMRALLARTGAALDAAATFEPDDADPQPPPNDSVIARLASDFGRAAGLNEVVVWVTQTSAMSVMPVAADRPTLVVGGAMLAQASEATLVWSVARAIKLLQLHGAVFARVGAVESASIVAGWLAIFQPQWTPPGVNAGAVAAVKLRIGAAVTDPLDPAAAGMARESAAALGPQLGALANNVVAWANRAALLAGGDLGAALDGIAAAAGRAGTTAAPQAERERATWITRTAEAKDLVAFAVTPAYVAARASLGL